MNKFTTDAIIIARTDYGDADRIYTFITSDHGKVQGIAKGVKKPKSRLAGGLQLFSVCHITFLVGRGEINTVMSTQLAKQYKAITKDLLATDAGYEMLNIVSKLTHEVPEDAHFALLQAGLEALDAHSTDVRLARLWFLMHFLQLGGHAPNFETDNAGNSLEASKKYLFDADAMQFVPAQNIDTALDSNHIKLLRLSGSLRAAGSLYKIKDPGKLLPGVEDVLKEAFVAVHRFQLQ